MLWNKGGSAKSMIVPLFSQTSKSILGGKQWVYGKITSNTHSKIKCQARGTRITTIQQTLKTKNTLGRMISFQLGKILDQR